MRRPSSVSLFDIRPDLRPIEVPAEAQDASVVVVVGSLNLRHTRITHLPRRLTVSGTCDIMRTAITQLPETLSVGGSFYLSETCISHLPEGLLVGEDLDISGTSIDHLPDGLSVGRDLNLIGTPMSQLPKGLVVGGNLFLQRTAITHLPACLSVSGMIFASPVLADLMTFRATLQQSFVLQSPLDCSAHARAHIHRLLAPYPDVLRIWHTMPIGNAWTIDSMS